MKIWMIAACAAIALPSLAQTEASKPDLKGWHLKGYNESQMYGINLDAAYKLLKSKKSSPVIVAVIDSGIDTTHEDLKPVLWRNPREIPGNKIDDDRNGYTDDVYGWNFLGGKDGRNVNKASAERTRVYHRFKTRFGAAGFNPATLTSKTDRDNYDMWKRASDEMQVSTTQRNEARMLNSIVGNLVKSDSILRKVLGRDTFSLQGLAVFQPADADGKKAKATYTNIMANMFGQSPETLNSFIQEVKDYNEGKQDALLALIQEPEDYRRTVIGDDYNNFNDRFYGNPDVMAGTPTHGTHVSGIIAAARNNGLGMDGVADNVRIMTVRAVPNGDEYDKDVALAIRYAVDNGAKVINMSFGKGYSPEKRWVDEALRYAEEKDVLVIHAAGNDHKNIDSTFNFPNGDLVTIGRRAGTLITVGASATPQAEGKMLADFSNYGRTNVDIFAPGVKIYSTLPGGTTYGFQDGTSMASPVVAGVAAMLRSYYPRLSALQIKEAIESSVRKIPEGTMVNLPGTDNEVLLSELSRTGGEIDAAAAVAAAARMAPASVTKPVKNVIPPVKKSNVRN